MSKPSWYFCSIVLVGATSACAHVGDSSPPAGEAGKPAIREHESVTGVTAARAKPVQPAKPGDLISTLASDLAQRLSVNVTQIEVVSVDPMTWNDSSLGCPQPGQSYLQAQTPGMRVVLRNNGQDYEYHTANSGAFSYCTSPTRTPDGLDRQ